MKEDYKKIAKDFGIKIRLGKYGVRFFPKDPNGKVYKFVSIIPLDGWITDPKEILQAIVDDGGSISYEKPDSKER